MKALGFRTLDGPGPRFLRGMAIAGANVPAYTYTAATNIDLGLAGFDDASIATNDVIYTDGEILPNTTTPPCDISVVHQGRLWLAGLSNPKELAWSQPYVETEAVRFTADFRTLVDDDIIGLASQDEKLLIFSGRSIRELIGDGPPASGDVDTGFRIRRVNTDVGCTGHRTIVPSPLGTFFHSSRGFQLLTRGMSVEYVGAAVEQKLKTQSITPIAGCLVPDQHHVRWLCVDGEGKRWIYVFDYKVQEWIIDLPGATIFTAGTDLFTFGAGAAGSEHCIVDTDGLVYFEDPDQGFDYEDFFSFVIETPWFHLNQCLQGWQRVRRVQLLGRNALVDPPDLVVEARWDYETAWTTLGTATPTELLAVAGAAGREFQVEFRIPDGKQRCEAIQLRVFDQANVDGGSGLGFRLSEICFQAGIKRGPKRLPETARAA